MADAVDVVAFMGSLMCRDTKGHPRGDIWYDETKMKTLFALVIGDAPFDIATLLAVYDEIAHNSNVLWHPIKMRTDKRIMIEPESGVVAVAWPLKPSEEEITAALARVLERMNAFAAAPPADEDERLHDLVVLLSDFLLLHPFTRGNGYMATVLLAALVRRTHAEQPVIQIGVHAGSRYREWCAAIIDHQKTGATDAAVGIIRRAIKEALRARAGPQ